ncbi:MAG: tetratricopeptide repeat protein [bacterium]
MLLKKILIMSSIVFIIGINISFAQDSGMSPQEKHARLEYLYRTAMDYFKQGKYSNAIYYWQAILNLDPTQTQPEKQIKEARNMIKSQTDPVYEEVRRLYKKGEYVLSQEKILVLLDIDSANQYYRKLYNKLQEVVEIFSVLNKDDKVSSLLRKAVVYYLDKKTNIRYSYIFCRYAAELSKDNQAALEFKRILEENYTEITEKESSIEGMNFIEQSLFVALDHIRKGRYDLAIGKCNDVLLVEPDNILALKRLGSAYYMMKKKDKSSEIWEKALKLSPNDAELKKFLNK